MILEVFPLMRTIFLIITRYYVGTDDEEDYVEAEEFEWERIGGTPEWREWVERVGMN